VREVIESVRRVTGKAIPVEECARRAGDPAVLVAGSEKIQARSWVWRSKFAELDATCGTARGSGSNGGTREGQSESASQRLRR